MMPSGGYKGVGVSLIVEIMAAAMTGQLFLAINPGATSGGRLAALSDEVYFASRTTISYLITNVDSQYKNCLYVHRELLG